MSNIKLDYNKPARVVLNPHLKDLGSVKIYTVQNDFIYFYDSRYSRADEGFPVRDYPVWYRGSASKTNGIINIIEWLP